MVSKSKLKPAHKKSQRWTHSLKHRLRPFIKGSGKVKLQLAIIFSSFVFIVYLLNLFFGYSSSTNYANYPKSHGIYLNEIASSTPLIYPYIEHTAVLKELGLNGLFIFRQYSDDKQGFAIKADDKPLTSDEIKKTTDQVLLVKRSFLDHGKLVYHRDGPRFVILTIIDFEKYNAETLVKIVQNRVDYAQRHGYGVHIRWLQEFIPLMEFQNPESDREYIKPMAIRATMHAFPNADYIFFMEQESLIMEMGFSLEKHIFDEKLLDVAIQKRLPITPGSHILTHSNTAPQAISLMFPRSQESGVMTNCMLIRNDDFSKSFIEYLDDPLIRDYNWDKFSSSISHAFQWHPIFLSKSAIVMPKLFASVYNPSKDVNKPLDGDIYSYSAGDFVVSFTGCQQRSSCVEDINTFYSMVQRA
ncbi:hypothetical protein TBLA_0C05640 [Henningerozyma blattae CBS 6284]|uniref:Alpha-1,6-mannosyltransferase n=1 Tax=Henningerozyma blattae (strain ATCC 34711 / CBS 6284 / DSM 70876 / NBRC 10599 / NRRL Y-10934 / UCD 77-7) TaxID=1071380 RepID=I2H1W0_HENB6|nr:hypothetical protein TBLA_0C05640 [Tetrapisispora blattae CBS 6284]CCH60362.1 hypothetical protein TBLA_0C05640 [Tetrapisispora blattae CBS 6284]